ncbi:MAG: outer rane efflux protein [Bryobacterales bacterium]|nr:outer rane efflux protein [Bryobacterales bacterium]
MSRLSLAIFIFVAGTSARLFAQMGATSSGAAGTSRAAQLPASGRTGTAGSVVTQQNASPSGGVASVNSSIQVSGDFGGSVLSGEASAGPITLTLAEAVKQGLRANLGTVSADNSVRAARAQRIQELSALLPNITANASETVTQVNLAAYGFQFNVPPGLNFSIPSVVGPFSYSQLQGALSQSIYDPVLRRNWQASKESERASVLSAKDTRELVVLAVGGTYLQTLAASARVDSQRAQVENAQAIHRQAVVRKEAGTNSKIDVMRSLVELQTEQQRLSSLEADLRKQKLSLARIVGLPLGQELTLSEPLLFTEAPIPPPPTAIQLAYTRRADLQAADAQVRAADRALSAAHAERLPSVSVNGDYGALGPNPTTAHGVFAVTGSVNMPIWQGGRVKGDIQQAEAALRQRQAELADARAAVEQEVRNALIELETAAGQVKLAGTNRDYARETLLEARDRFAAGVATTVEVVQAQEQVAGAESDYISSLFSFDLAKLALARATGEAETDIPDLLKGNRRP